MAKQSTYPPASTLAGPELILIVQGGDTLVTTPAQLYTYLFSGFGANTFPGRSSAGALAAKPLSDFALTLLDDANAAAARATLDVQQADATLSAISGLTTGANKLPYFTGTDAATTTDLSAFARTFLDDADAAAVRTTLGFANGIHTPTLTNTTNVASSTPLSAQYLRVGNTVTVSGTLTVQATAAASTLTTLGVSLPVASDLANANELGGSGALLTAPVLISGDATNNRATFQWNSLSTSAVTLSYHFSYRVI